MHTTQQILPLHMRNVLSSIRYPEYQLSLRSFRNPPGAWMETVPVVGDRIDFLPAAWRRYQNADCRGI